MPAFYWLTCVFGLVRSADTWVPAGYPLHPHNQFRDPHGIPAMTSSSLKRTTVVISSIEATDVGPLSQQPAIHSRRRQTKINRTPQLNTEVKPITDSGCRCNLPQSWHQIRYNAAIWARHTLTAIRQVPYSLQLS
jgi:hypothetical protein